MKAMKWLLIGAALALSGCFPAKKLGPLPGDPVKACRSGIREACALLAMQQNAMRDLHQQAVTTPAYRPVYVYGPRPGGQMNTTCRSYTGTTYCNSNYQ